MAEWMKLRMLGEGSSATVYLGLLKSPQKESADVIAIKSSEPDTTHALQREGNILQRFLGCKEIIQILGSQITIEKGDSICNLFMEFAPFGSLSVRIQRGKIPESEAILYTRMLLKGLSHIHKVGIVHCDLKPDNILLFPTLEKGVPYQLKIADFGLSKTEEEEIEIDSWPMSFRGTPVFMSPESILGQIDAPSDIWSLGCILLQMVTGLEPWWDIDSVDEILFRVGVLKEAPKIPRGTRVSPICEDFIGKCFTVDPDQRWTANMLLNHPFLNSKIDSGRS